LVLKYSSKTKWTAFTVNDKISIIAQVDEYIGACVELASQLGMPVFTLDTTVENHEEIESYVVQCGPFLEAVEFFEMFTNGGTGISTCHMFQLCRF
jgi:molybdopterin biosynthesis enzyme MoaB